MSKKRKRNKMNEQQITNTPETAPVREVIGTNPDGTPIYREETVQAPEHTGEVEQLNPM